MTGAHPTDRAGRPTAQAPAGLGEPATIPCAVIGFTGTQRDMTAVQREVLMSALVGFRENGAIWMHNGDCIEADEYAGQVWNAIGGSIHLHPPTNESKRAYLNNLLNVHSAPARPYLARNRDIADAATVLIATPRDVERKGGGTWFTINAARKRRIPIMIISPTGKIAYEHWPIAQNGAA